MPLPNETELAVSNTTSPPTSLTDLLTKLAGDGSSVRRLRRGEALFHLGDEAWAVFLVERGRVRLLRHGLEGRQVIAGVANVGMTMAEAALYSPTYHCDAFAEIPSTVRAFRKDRLLARLRADAGLAEAYSRAQAHQLQEARTRLELRSIRRADERIEAALAAGLGPRGPRSLAGFATELGLAPETLYRALARLERQGRIVRHRTRIEWTGGRPG